MRPHWHTPPDQEIGVTQPPPTAGGRPLTTVDNLVVEAQIRAAYRDLAAQPGMAVPLAAIRAAIPPDVPRESVDAALRMLDRHAGVYLNPAAGRRDADDRAAAIHLGGQAIHLLIVYARPSIDELVHRLWLRDRATATSMVAALDDVTVAQVADRLGVEPAGAAGVRHRLVETVVAAHEEWLADARQGADDAGLLYRADTEPHAVAGWTDTDREQVRQAARRLLQRADREPSWAYIRDRATRWAGPSTSDTTGHHPQPLSAAEVARRAGSRPPADATPATGTAIPGEVPSPRAVPEPRPRLRR